MKESIWSRFSADPRIHGAVRASDADRAVVAEALSEAYALGQISADEFDERFDAAERVKTLGEVPALVEDLVVEAGELEPAAMDDKARAQALARLEDERVPITPEQIAAAAEKYYRNRVRQALFGMIAGPVGITVAIWAATSIAAGSLIFFWPIFVIVPVLFGALSHVTGKDRIISNRKKELTQRARAHLGDAEASRSLEERSRTGSRPEADEDIGIGPHPGLHGLPSQPHPFASGHRPRSKDEIRRRRREARSRRRRARDD